MTEPLMRTALKFSASNIWIYLIATIKNSTENTLFSAISDTSLGQIQGG